MKKGKKIEFKIGDSVALVRGRSENPYEVTAVLLGGKMVVRGSNDSNYLIVHKSEIRPYDEWKREFDKNQARAEAARLREQRREDKVRAKIGERNRIAAETAAVIEDAFLELVPKALIGYHPRGRIIMIEIECSMDDYMKNILPLFKKK